MRIDASALVSGRATGQVLVLDEPLSFWGGVDGATGLIIDRHHPQCDASIVGRILVMPRGRGSSSSSSVLAETIRNGVAPAGIILGAADPIIALGAMIAEELYGVSTPVVVVDAAGYAACAAAGDLTIDGTRVEQR